MFLRNMMSISMDGPNVNWKFFELLQQEHAAFKCGFSMWQVEKVR